MVKRPLLRLPTPTSQQRTKGVPANDPNAGLPKLSAQRQNERLGPKFERLRNLIDQSNATLLLKGDPDGIAPERALVFEVAGSLQDFYSQAQRLPGLAFLFDEEVALEPDSDFYKTKKQGTELIRSEEPLGGHLYMAMPDINALRHILRLWRMFLRGQKLPPGFAPWSMLFTFLRDVRAWGPKDRVPTETIAYWRERLAASPNLPVRFEVDLWFYEQTTRRLAAFAEIRRSIESCDGRIINSCELAPICYHGLIVDLPPSRIREMLDIPNVTLSVADEIMFIRPQSNVSHAIWSDDESDRADGGDHNSAGNDDTKHGALLPIAALLDGVPIESHVYLKDRLIVDDPDDVASVSPVNKRSHGTSMASLIINGDLWKKSGALQRPLYIRPLMVYNPATEEESFPQDQMPLDVVYQAVRRMKEGDGDTPATAESVLVVNLSLGDRNRPYAGRMSPWARLLDWLSFKYRVLFLVSSGNINTWLQVPGYKTRGDIHSADPSEREERVLAALNLYKAKRSILSPAESINSITVGALHADASKNRRIIAGHVFDPFPGGNLPNVTSALGLGHRRAIKPEILHDGGCELVKVSEDEGAVWINAGGQSGQLTAAPDYTGSGRLNATGQTCGTSNAVALTTRAAVQLHDALLSSGLQLPQSHGAVVLKALLVHGAAWGPSGDRLEKLFGPPGRAYQPRRDNVARFLGYGKPDIERVMGCLAQRATLFGYGDIEEDKQDVYVVPLPPSLEGVTEFRRLTVTLAWFSPTSTRHQAYRSAVLEAWPGGDKDFSLAVRRVTAQPNHQAVDRGTVYHCVFEGKAAIAFIDEGFIKVRVTCRSQTGRFYDSIPYALTISIETAIDSKIAVYDEIALALTLAVREGVRTR